MAVLLIIVHVLAWLWLAVLTAAFLGYVAMAVILTASRKSPTWEAIVFMALIGSQLLLYATPAIVVLWLTWGR